MVLFHCGKVRSDENPEEHAEVAIGLRAAAGLRNNPGILSMGVYAWAGSLMKLLVS